uniref:Splicing factor Cactin n=1 Tax=Mantoniella antarctica TaxID=81844 RepID=A0A7S0SB60_9CHLO
MARKLAVRLKQGEIAGYTDQENPFGDANLTERFVWHKKIEKSLMSGMDPKELGLKAEKKRHVERLKEIEKVKEQRETRDRERMEKEEEREIMQREEALIEAVELEIKEEEFHLQQARMRSDIRVKEGRARAIDLVSRNLHADPGAPEFDATVHPLMIFDGLTLREIDELKDDLRTYLDLDHKNEKHRTFWHNLLTVADAELTEAKLREDMERAHVRGLEISREVLEQGLHSSVEGDVREMLDGRSLRELEELEGEIEQQLRGPDAGETEYWGAVLKRIVVHKARVSVGNVDAECRAAQASAVPRNVPPPPPGGRGAAADEDEDLLGADFGNAAGGAGAGGDRSDGEEDGDGGGDSGGDFSPRGMSPEPMSPRAESDGEEDGTPDRSFSPDAIRAREDEPEYLEVVDEAEDLAQLARLRATEKSKKMKAFNEAANRHGGKERANGAHMVERQTFDAYKASHAKGAAGKGSSIQPSENAYDLPEAGAPGGKILQPTKLEREAEEAHARRGTALAEKMMGDSAGAEVTFAGEAPLESQVYWWHDKYRPRKPKYFNRVHTGYEWNKYNQTHYDHDNPPPKTVQGYKFNLFFPDLIEKHKAPTYTIMPDGSKHGETCILRIHAGPPYEDIAFKIVNKEWEYSNKKGFRCSFDRGIFHLYINFMRSRYRR